MLGVEVVQSTESKKPAPAAAAHIKEAMLQHRVLMTVDGPACKCPQAQAPYGVCRAGCRPHAGRAEAGTRSDISARASHRQRSSHDEMGRALRICGLQLAFCVTSKAKSQDIKRHARTYTPIVKYQSPQVICMLADGGSPDFLLPLVSGLRDACTCRCCRRASHKRCWRQTRPGSQPCR